MNVYIKDWVNQIFYQTVNPTVEQTHMAVTFEPYMWREFIRDDLDIKKWAQCGFHFHSCLKYPSHLKSSLEWLWLKLKMNELDPIDSCARITSTKHCTGDSRSCSFYLNDDFLIEILSRLPPKSPLRFKCMSKSWRNLISNSLPSSPVSGFLHCLGENNKQKWYVHFSGFCNNNCREVIELWEASNPQRQSDYCPLLQWIVPVVQWEKCSSGLPCVQSCDQPMPSSSWASPGSQF